MFIDNKYTKKEIPGGEEYTGLEAYEQHAAELTSGQMRGRKSIWMHDPNFSDEEDHQADEDSHRYPTDKLEDPDEDEQERTEKSQLM